VPPVKKHTHGVSSTAERTPADSPKAAEERRHESFDDPTPQKGQGGLRTKGTPGSVVPTEWRGSDIWLRRESDLNDREFTRPYLLIHHNEDAEVYINGRLVAKLEGYTTGYVHAGLDEKALNALKVGSNCIAVHCRQTTEGQYIDVGLVDVKQKSEK